MAEAVQYENGITGAELATAIEREADCRGLTAAQLAAALSRWPDKWLFQLRVAKRPKSATIARVKALIERGDLPAAPPNNFQKSGDRKPPLHVAGRGAGAADENLPPRIDREPCPWCAVRADVGCRHLPQRATPGVPAGEGLSLPAGAAEWAEAEVPLASVSASPPVLMGRE